MFAGSLANGKFGGHAVRQSNLMMNRSKFRLVAAVLGVCALGASANAGLLFVQDTDFNGAIASQNDTTGGNGNYATAYDDFTLGVTSTVTGFDWVGSYFNPSSPGDITGWTISVYADQGGFPGTLISSEAYADNGGETYLGLDNQGDPTYSYSESYNPFTAWAGRPYWISVVPDLGYPPQWGWESGTGGDGVSYQSFFGTWTETPNDLAFSVEGNSGATPGPAAVLPMIVGLIGLARRRRV
jgi:MYXO-CTERM domain-containing protein